MLRYAADIRTLAYAAVTTVLFFYQWHLGSINWFIYPVYLFLSVAVTVIAHNHNHVPIWRNKILNALTDYWLTVFYGFPAFGWIPTHNMNHHSLNNKEGDYTITYRLTERNSLWMVLLYPSVSSYYQQIAIREYLKSLKRDDKSYYWFAISQYVVLAVWIIAALIINWKSAILFVLIPQQFGLFSVLVFNYVQHVHADEESQWNHSRNFEGILNLMLFNNGFHTVHHERAGTHWSKNREAHMKVRDKIDPVLLERGFWPYIIRSYFIGGLIRKYGTTSMRLKRMGLPLETKHVRSKAGTPRPA